MKLPGRDHISLLFLLMSIVGFRPPPLAYVAIKAYSRLAKTETVTKSLTLLRAQSLDQLAVAK